jgi:hypothetical protein
MHGCKTTRASLSMPATIPAPHDAATCIDKNAIFSPLGCLPAPVCSPLLAFLQGFGGFVDLFFGQPSGSSIIHMRHTQRLRMACAPGSQLLLTVRNTPRSKLVPGADQPQLTRAGDVTWNVRTCYNVTVRFSIFSHMQQILLSCDQLRVQ